MITDIHQAKHLLLTSNITDIHHVKHLLLTSINHPSAYRANHFRHR